MIPYTRDGRILNNPHPLPDSERDEEHRMYSWSLCGFLESLYRGLGRGVGCLVESPVAERDRCYVNTNLLGAHALRVCSSPLAGRVEAFAKRYRGLRFCRYRVLWRERIPYPPPTAKRVRLGALRSTNGEQLLVLADTCGPVLPDWTSYADLLVLGALERLRQHSYSAAWRLHQRLLGMWSGTGFRDKAYTATGLYESYKLALYYFLARALHEDNHVTDWIRANICKLVRRDGGVVTHYDDALRRHGDANLETTALTILALYSNYPDRFPYPARTRKTRYRLL